MNKTPIEDLKKSAIEHYNRISEAELTEKLNIENEAIQQRYEAQKILQDRRAEAMKQAEKMVSNLPKTTIQASTGSIYVAPTLTLSNKPAIRFYKIDSKGTFGRVTVSTYLSEKFEIELDKFQPLMKGKQLKPAEITTKQVHSINGRVLAKKRTFTTKVDTKHQF